MRINNLSEISKLSTAEKILFVEDLWDNITKDETNILIPQSHKDELDRRQQRYRSNPGNLLSLEKLQERIAKRK